MCATFRRRFTVNHIRKAFAAAGMAAVIAAGSCPASAALDDWWPMRDCRSSTAATPGIRFPAQETRVSVWSVSDNV